MNTSLKSLLAIVAVALPSAAFAQSNDANYCNALVGKYEQYLDMSSKRGMQPQSVEARVAVEKCKTGDPAGIPGIEKALDDAGFSLPSLAPPAGSTPVNAANCGVETWSTEKMMYVGVPCVSGTASEVPAATTR